MKLPESIQKKLKLEPGATYGDAVALQSFDAALEGDIAATREIRKAIEGKSTIRTDRNGHRSESISARFHNIASQFRNDASTV